MRTAVNQFMAHALSLETLAATARDLGVHGVGVFRPCLEELGASAVSRTLGRAGLRPTSVCVVLGLTGATSDQQRARIDDARRALRQASDLGAPLVVVAGGPGDQPASRVLAEFENQLAVLAADADREGVRLLLEPLHPALTHLSVLTSLRDACRAASRYRHMGVVLDTWHVWSEPDLVETARTYAKHIDVVHLSDWRPGPFTERRALPGEGVMNLAALGNALRDVLTDAWWELEVIDEDATGPETQRKLLRDAVRAARTCGLFGEEETCASPSSAARPAARAR
jgi:sugar phosphate isomerase/epimerase